MSKIYKIGLPVKKVCWVISSPLIIRFFLINQIEMLSREVDLTIITNVDDISFASEIKGNFKIISIGVERKPSPLKDLKTLLQLLIIFRRERYDLIHSLSPKTGLLGMIAAWLANTPLRVHTFQGEVWITRTGLWRFLLKTLDTVMARCATHLLVVSRSEESFLIREGVVSAGRLEMLANGSICGVDTARFRPDAEARVRVRELLGIPASDQVILYVGRFNIDKGLLDLASAFARIKAAYPNAHLLFVGPDEENIRPKIEKICDAFTHHLHFVGYTSQPELYMAASDLLCLPSYREGFGMVLLEAAATGLPTIGSRIYGITDAIVDGVTGLLFEPADVVDLTNKLMLLLNDKALARRLGDAGQKRAHTDFRNDKVSLALLDYYRALLRA